MALVRKCSECPNLLTGKGPQAKTCSDVCRAKRSRRIRRAKKNAGGNPYPEHMSQLQQAMTTAAPDIAHEVIREEMRPIAREAITEDVLRAIHELVALTPRAIECLAEDLHSHDPGIRQRAYLLITKYTIGHQALVRPEDAQAGQQLVVNFTLPRPGSEPHFSDAVTGAAVELDEPDIRTCDSCGEDKPVTQFVAKSDRCVACYEAQRDRAAHLFE